LEIYGKLWARIKRVMITIIKIACSILAGFFAGPAIVYFFNRMPAKWLCDYGETPSQELTDPNVKRIKENPWRWIYAVGFICLCLRLSLANLVPSVVQGGHLFIAGLQAEPLSDLDCAQLALAGLIACWLLLMIALADLKYMIIPDQFVIMLAISAIAFLPFRGSIIQPLLGLAIGGGAMLVLAGIGALAKKEMIGFGDVKLCAALGLVLGIRGIICALTAAVLAAGIYAAAGLVSGKLKAGDHMPMGPFICGCATAYIFIALW